MMFPPAKALRVEFPIIFVVTKFRHKMNCSNALDSNYAPQAWKGFNKKY